jgi:hypothetical protein
MWGVGATYVVATCGARCPTRGHQAPRARSPSAWRLIGGSETEGEVFRYGQVILLKPVGESQPDLNTPDSNSDGFPPRFPQRSGGRSLS